MNLEGELGDYLIRLLLYWVYLKRTLKIAAFSEKLSKKFCRNDRIAIRLDGDLASVEFTVERLEILKAAEDALGVADNSLLAGAVYEYKRIRLSGSCKANDLVVAVDEIDPAVLHHAE